MVASMLIFSLGGALALGDTPPAAAAEATDAQSGDQALVCRSFSRRGSRIEREVCRPAETWRAEEPEKNSPLFGWGFRPNHGGASGCYGSGC